MKTVFHLNSSDTKRKSELLGNIRNLIDDETVEVDEIAAVVNGDAVEMVEKGSESEKFIRDFPDKVSFKACENSVENREIGELVEGVEKVSSAVAELNRLQESGYNYVKVN